MEIPRVTDCRFSTPAIEGAVRDVCRVLERSNQQRAGWKSVSEDLLWRELVSCILGSRVNFELAHVAIERMAKADLFSEKKRTSANQKYERDIVSALWGKARRFENSEMKNRYPFPKLRAGQIREAAKLFYSKSNSIRGLLEAAGSAQDARRYLASEVAGLGPKQASLFLRNIGFTSYVAVLDVHVLTYMNWVGLTTIPMKSIRTMKQYEELEDVFIEHSCSFGYPPDCFDIAVWVVVRVAKKEVDAWHW